MAKHKAAHHLNGEGCDDQHRRVVPRTDLNGGLIDQHTYAKILAQDFGLEPHDRARFANEGLRRVERPNPGTVVHQPTRQSPNTLMQVLPHKALRSFRYYPIVVPLCTPPRLARRIGYQCRNMAALSPTADQCLKP